MRLAVVIAMLFLSPYSSIVLLMFDACSHKVTGGAFVRSQRSDVVWNILSNSQRVQAVTSRVKGVKRRMWGVGYRV